MLRFMPKKSPITSKSIDFAAFDRHCFAYLCKTMRRSSFLFKLLFLCLSFSISTAEAQVINGYAKVSAINGNDFAVSNLDQTGDNFEVGQLVVIMQMQDDVIGSNTANDTSFGLLSNIQNAGIYELAAVDAIDGNSTNGFTKASFDTISFITVANTYNIGTHASVQIISFNELSANNYTTSANLLALAWDGNVGGVLAVNVPDTLILNHELIANGRGFRGGSVSNNNSGPICDSASTVIFKSSNNNYGFKGEGIYRSTAADEETARARILNGGGGGADHNGGGGGGGNYSEGGDGGIGYNNCTTFPTGGYGGIGLSAHISASRVFMGGGGGGGQQNNSNGTDGGDGGGIIFVKASVVKTNPCTVLDIAVNGETTPDGGNDGGGGGGAGGSIIFDVDAWDLSSSCVLSIEANGGNGSSSLTGTVHGGGGGGSQGVIIFSGAAPDSNATFETNNGDGGCNDNSSPCTSTASSPSTPDSSGVVSNGTGPLPIRLISFTATKEDSYAHLNWITNWEENNDHFQIQKSTDAAHFETIAKISGKNGTGIQEYSYVDRKSNSGVSYYRLKQVDHDGSAFYSTIKSVEHNKERIGTAFKFYPNPANQEIFIQASPESLQQIKVFNMVGQNVDEQCDFVRESDDQLRIDISQLRPGAYFIKSTEDAGIFFKK